MRSKAPLVLMEQLLMLLVFALAAAVCIQAFALSDQLSRQCADRDQAVIAAQTTAEVLKYHHGDYAAAASDLAGVWDGATMAISFNENWQPASGKGSYYVLVMPLETEAMVLGAAQVMVYTAEGDCIYQLTPAWQEAAG